MAKLCNATLYILGLATDLEKHRIQFEAERIRKEAEKQGIKTVVDIIKSKYSSAAILNYAKEKKADLIVAMADLDKVAISEYIAGPVIQHVVNHSSIPILSIQPLKKNEIS